MRDTGTRGGIRFPGTYYQVSGAKRGPAPAQPVGIWVGAYKPRMLSHLACEERQLMASLARYGFYGYGDEG